MWLFYIFFLISLPLHEIINIKTFFTVKLFHILIALLACTLFLKKAISSDRIKGSPLDICMLFFLLSYVLSLVVAQDIARGTRIIFALLSMYLSYYLTINIVTSKKKFITALKVIVWTSAAVSLYGIYQIAGYLMGYDTGVVFGYDKWFLPRINVAMQEPAYLANYLLLSLAILLSYSINKEYKLLGRAKTYICLFLVVTAFALTISRGAFIGAFLAFPIILLAKSNSFGVRTNRAMLVCGLVFLCFIIYQLARIGFSKTAGMVSTWDLINTSFLSKAGGSYTQRLEFNQTAWNMFLAHPFLGVGPYNFTIRYDEYKPVWAVMSGELGLIPNNIILQLLAENGIVGLTLFAAIIWKVVSLASKFLRKLSEYSFEFVTVKGLLFGFVAMFLHYVFTSSIYFPHFWVLMALLVKSVTLFNPAKAGEDI